MKPLGAFRPKLAVSLEEFFPLVKVNSDRSWKHAGRGYRTDPKAHLERYIKLVLGDEAINEGVEGRRPGQVLFVVGPRSQTVVDSAFDLYGLLDKALAAAPDGPYVAYGALLFHGYRLSLYKWERHADGQVTKNSADMVLCFNHDDEIRDFIGPVVRGMVEDVGIKGGGVEVLVPGVDFEHMSYHTFQDGPNLAEYPIILPTKRA